jgi:hypothetical protein
MNDCERERDYWKQVAQELSQRVEDLESQLELADIKTRAIGRGAIGRGAIGELTAAIQELQRERNSLRRQLAEANRLVPTTMIRRPVYRDQHQTPISEDELRELPPFVLVDVMAIYRQPGRATTQAHTWHIEPGTLEQVMPPHLQQIGAAQNRSPKLADIGNRTVNGLTTDELFAILDDLTPYRDMNSGEYHRRRKFLLDTYIPRIQERGFYLGAKGRNTASTNLRDFIETAFKNRDERLSKSTNEVDIPPDLFKPKSLEDKPVASLEAVVK